jgi:K+-transporting ATPase A subunit
VTDLIEVQKKNPRTVTVAACLIFGLMVDAFGWGWSLITMLAVIWTVGMIECYREWRAFKAESAT